uniref:Uncharacterized protein n=1 Tax=Molossus molossus TaxID=27622 RepID=A0A7J8FSH7_MOLMO|nr:hypothetical protein HJG59_008456 [Molossus molossus]
MLASASAVQAAEPSRLEQMDKLCLPPKAKAHPLLPHPSRTLGLQPRVAGTQLKGYQEGRAAAPSLLRRAGHGAPCWHSWAKEVRLSSPGLRLEGTVRADRTRGSLDVSELSRGTADGGRVTELSRPRETEPQKPQKPFYF